MRVGYVRVSTEEQNTARQQVLMDQLRVDRVFVDKISGKNTNRPALKKMLSFIRSGDVVVVESISRLARNTKDLLELVDRVMRASLYVIFARTPRISFSLAS